MHRVWNLQKTLLYPIKPLLFSSNKVGKAISYIPQKRALNENNAAYEVKRKKVLLFHTPSTGHNRFPSHYNQRERMGTWEKKSQTGSKK